MKRLAKVMHTIAACSLLILSSTLVNAKEVDAKSPVTHKTFSNAFNIPSNLVQQESAELTKKIQAAILKNEAQRVAGYWSRRSRTVYVPRRRTRTTWVRRTRTVWVPRQRTRWVRRTRTRTVYVPRRVTRTVYVRTRSRRRVRVRYVPVRYRPRVRTIYYSVCPD